MNATYRTRSDTKRARSSRRRRPCTRPRDISVVSGARDAAPACPARSQRRHEQSTE